MKKLSITLLLLTLLFSISTTVQAKTKDQSKTDSQIQPQPELKSDPQPIPPAILNSVVMILSQARKDGTFDYGTGFFISQYGHILTNYHILNGQLFKLCLPSTDENSAYQVICLESTKLNVIAKNRELDLALLQLPQTGQYVTNSFLNLANSVQKGDKIKIPGYPESDSLSLKISEGQITKIAKKYLITDAKVSPGNSGSPVLNDKNEVIGMAAAIINEDNQGLLISSDTIKEWLASIGFNLKNEPRHMVKPMQSEKFTFKTDTFSIDFPGRPKNFSIKIGSEELNYFFYPKNENEAMFIFYSAIPAEDRKKKTFDLNEEDLNFFGEGGTKIEKIKLHKYKGYQALSMEMKTGENYYMKATFYKLDNKIVGIGVLGLNGYPTDETVNDLVSSFKLL